MVVAESLISQAVIADKPAEVRQLLDRARGESLALASLEQGDLAAKIGPLTASDRQRIQQLIGRALLVEAQKLATLQGPTFALPALLKARDHYLGMITPGQPLSPTLPQGGGGISDDCFARLESIGKLLEQMREWETAVALYRQIATQFPQLPAGRDALLRVAQIYDADLDAPLAALDVYAEYSARYPAELPYRQLALGDRLRRLGYANLLDFQKRNSLKTDGLFGPSSTKRLDELEASFDLIRVPGVEDAAVEKGDEGSDGTPVAGPQTPAVSPEKSAKRKANKKTLTDSAGATAGHPNNILVGSSTILRGEFVHPAILAIAQRLGQAGRHRDAIVAYRLFLNLFPAKAQANDCLLAIARLFRDDLLFEEALGAYRQLMADYPKGSQTSEAYIEAAVCLENLGRWKQAKELYDLYVRNFPKYPRVALCKTRLALLDEIIQYAEFIASNPANPKVAEAQYQTASILYKEFGPENLTKAAVEFKAVADGHPKHVRAADGLFTAGTCQLKAENFPAARALYAALVERYPESRLAGAAQYWIGHTYEYWARALGKLDNSHIVLKRRGLKGRIALATLANLPLRQFYYPAATSQAEVSEATWGGDVLGVGRINLGSVGVAGASGDWGALASGSKRDRVNADLFAAIAAYRKVVDNFKMSEMAGNALLRIGTIYTEYLNDPDQGAEAFRELLAHYPGSHEAINALFEVGSYQVKQKKFDEAIKSYQQFIFNYPNESKVEDAMIAIARCHAEQQAWDKALDAYQNYLTKFPAGHFATTARGQVEWIRMYHF